MGHLSKSFLQIFKVANLQPDKFSAAVLHFLRAVLLTIFPPLLIKFEMFGEEFI